MTKRFLQICSMAIFLPLSAHAENDSISPISTISLKSVVVDKTLPELVRKAFVDDDGKPMKSVSVYLSNEKMPEKLVPNEFLCGSGGCPWVVYSPKLNKVIGYIHGHTITVLKDSNEGYKSIETLWRLGIGTTDTLHYKFHNGAYEKTD